MQPSSVSVVIWQLIDLAGVSTSECRRGDIEVRQLPVGQGLELDVKFAGDIDLSRLDKRVPDHCYTTIFHRLYWTGAGRSRNPQSLLLDTTQKSSPLVKRTSELGAYRSPIPGTKILDSDVSMNGTVSRSHTSQVTPIRVSPTMRSRPFQLTKQKTRQLLGATDFNVGTTFSPTSSRNL